MKVKLICISLLISTTFKLAAQDTMESAFEKSYALEKTGNYAAAINAVKTVYSPGDYEGNLRLGYLYYEAGQHAEAMNYYLRAITLYPNAVEPKMGYVYPASMLGKWDDVVKQYQEILKLDPKNTNVNYKLGLIYYNRKMYAVAYKYFETVVSLYPFDYDGLLMFAWTDLQLGKVKEARAGFNKVLLLSPRDKSALEGLSLLK
jgi:tetratricopeptide (TPR) repeat protein